MNIDLYQYVHDIYFRFGFETCIVTVNRIINIDTYVSVET